MNRKAFFKGVDVSSFSIFYMRSNWVGLDIYFDVPILLLLAWVRLQFVRGLVCPYYFHWPGLNYCLLRGSSPSHPASPLLRHPLLDLSCSFFLKSLFDLPFFLFRPLLRYFRQFPHPHAIPSCPNLTHQPFLHITDLKKYQKSDFASSTIAFYQKSIFNYCIALQICKYMRLF